MTVLLCCFYELRMFSRCKITDTKLVLFVAVWSGAVQLAFAVMQRMLLVTLRMFSRNCVSSANQRSSLGIAGVRFVYRARSDLGSLPRQRRVMAMVLRVDTHHIDLH